MKVNVLYFGELRETVGLTGEAVTLGSPSGTVGDLIQTLAARGDPWRNALHDSEPLRVAINQTMASRDSALSAGCEVAFFRPVTGG